MEKRATIRAMYSHTNFKGLSQKEVEENSVLYGKNILPEKEKVTLYHLFFKQFLSPFVYVLLIVAFISLVIGEPTDAVIIVTILVINALVGMYQEYKANNAIKALKKLSHAKTRVIRDGSLATIRTEDITVDDVVYVESGDIIPADGEVLELHQLMVNESQITGESIPIMKEKNAQVFKSSIVVSGSAFISIKKIGAETFIGAIATDISKNIGRTSELNKKLSHFSSRLLLLLAAVVSIFIVFTISTGTELIEALRTGAALGIAVVPEGLPVVITVVLSLGALHISKAKALLRNLQSGSTLASVSYICTDKTGTLTHGDLSVKEVVRLDNNSIGGETFNEYLYHSLDIKTINGEKVGDMLELTLEKYLNGSFTYKEVKESPFTSEAKYNAKEFLINHEHIQIFKGAPEAMHISDEVIEPFVKEGYRVIAIGYKKNGNTSEFTTHDVIPLALVVFEDKIRTEAAKSIADCKKAGISVLMITGDNVLTAKHVAHEVGIADSDNDLFVTGKMLDDMDDDELYKKIHSIKVIARANPMHKERIVKILQEHKEVVAMTGDGVNDGPALSLADIGISMGKSGTEVAKEASDLILVNDDFSDIVLAIFEARTISENIRKTLMFLMTSAFSIVVSTLISVTSGSPLPFLAVQILWLNFVTSGFLDVAVSTEKAEKVFRNYKYTRYTGSLLNAYDMTRVIFLGSYIGIFTALTFFALGQMFPLDVARTGAMVLISSFIWFNAINVRKNYDTVFSFNPFSNLFVVGAIVIEAIILLSSVYFSVGNTLLHTTRIDPVYAITFIIFASTIFVVDTLIKVTHKLMRKIFPRHGF